VKQTKDDFQQTIIDMNNNDPEFELSRAVREMIKYRTLYYGARARADQLQLWCDGYRHLVREKHCQDTNRLLEILDELEKT
jgi:hypothetical protein